MSNVYTFTQAADAAVATVKTEGKLWNNLAGWVATLTLAGATPEERKASADALIKGAAEEYTLAHPRAPKLGDIGAYRSAKSLVLSAIGADVTLLNSNGKVKGKTELTDEINAKKVEKSAIEKFRIVHTNMASVGDKLLTLSELEEATKLLEDTYAKLASLRNHLRDTSESKAA